MAEIKIVVCAQMKFPTIFHIYLFLNLCGNEHYFTEVLGTMGGLSHEKVAQEIGLSVLEDFQYLTW